LRATGEKYVCFALYPIFLIVDVYIQSQYFRLLLILSNIVFLFFCSSVKTFFYWYLAN